MTSGPMSEMRVSDGWATGALFLPDGSVLTTAVDTLVRRWDPEGGLLLGTYEGHEKSVDAMAVTSDGRLLVTGSVDGTARVWDLDSGVEQLVLAGHKKTVAGVAIADEPGLVATASYDGTVGIWGIPLGEQRDLLRGHPRNVVSAAFSPDATLLATGGIGDDELRVWRIPSGELLEKLPGHSQATAAVRFTPDGTLLVTTGADNLLRVLSVDGWELQSEVAIGGGGTHALALSPEGGTAAVTADNEVVMVDLVSGVPMKVLPFDVKGVYGVSFSPDGSVLATASSDGMLRLWEVAAR